MKHFLTVIFTLLTLISFATTVPVSKALQVVMTQASTTNAKLVQTVYDNKNHPVMYFINYTSKTDTGAYIISANDRVGAILAVLDDAYIPTDIDSLEIGFRDWIHEKRDIIQFSIDNNIKATPQITSEWNQVSTTKLSSSRASDYGPNLTTTWDQWGWYSRYCPYDSANNAISLNGCNSVTLGQMIKFLGFPINPTGKIDLNCYVNGRYERFTINFDTVTFKYSEMPNAVNSTNYYETAKMLAYIAKAIQSDFAAYGTGGYVFGTSYPSDHKLLITNLGFDATYMKEMQKANYTDSLWLDMLTVYISTDGVLQYVGYDDNGYGGHTWVCDGIKTINGVRMPHMNWGWGGQYNGYYAVGALNAGGYKFNSQTGALVGFRPKGGVTPPPTCSSPTVTSIIADTIPNETIKWNSVSGATNYLFQYKKTSDPSFIDSLTTNNFITLKKLPFATNYSYQITTKCPLGNSTVTQGSFTTPAAPVVVCDTIKGITAIPTQKTANIKWNKSKGASSYTVSYSNTSIFTTVSVIDTFVNLTNLIPSSIYKYQIKPSCGNASAMLSFKTLDTIPIIPPVDTTSKYCTFVANSTSWGDYIKSVTINGITNTSGNNGGYKDYTNILFTLKSSNALAYSLGFSIDHLAVYIDLNQDKKFTFDELVAIDTKTFNINSFSGTRRMRVITYFNKLASTCNNDYGEAEDYTVGYSIAIAQPLDNIELKVYPNPASTLLNIHFIQGADINIYNTNGQVVIQDQMDSDLKILDISNLQSGLYIVETTLPDNRRDIKRVIITK